MRCEQARGEGRSDLRGALSEFYTHCKPKMEDYDVNVRAEAS